MSVLMFVVVCLVGAFGFCCLLLAVGVLVFEIFASGRALVAHRPRRTARCGDVAGASPYRARQRRADERRACSELAPHSNCVQASIRRAGGVVTPRRPTP